MNVTVQDAAPSVVEVSDLALERQSLLDSIAFLIGGAVVPVIGPKAAYLLGGVTGLIGTAPLVPLLR